MDLKYYTSVLVDEPGAGSPASTTASSRCRTRTGGRRHGRRRRRSVPVTRRVTRAGQGRALPAHALAGLEWRVPGRGRHSMHTEWMKVMLEEVARKREEAEPAARKSSAAWPNAQPLRARPRRPRRSNEPARSIGPAPHRNGSPGPPAAAGGRARCANLPETKGSHRWRNESPGSTLRKSRTPGRHGPCADRHHRFVGRTLRGRSTGRCCCAALPTSSACSAASGSRALFPTRSSSTSRTAAAARSCARHQRRARLHARPSGGARPAHAEGDRSRNARVPSRGGRLRWHRRERAAPVQPGGPARPLAGFRAHRGPGDLPAAVGGARVVALRCRCAARVAARASGGQRAGRAPGSDAVRRKPSARGLCRVQPRRG